MEEDTFSKYGIILEHAWLQKFIAVSSLGMQRGGQSTELLFQALLDSDISSSVASNSLPSNIQDMHSQTFPGPCILQVNEVHNIGENFEKRNQETAKRCLKFFMSDGSQQILGMEYQHIPDLKISMPPGYKIMVANVTVKRGMLLLTEENVHLLGGQVDELVKLWEKSHGIKDKNKDKDKAAAEEEKGQSVSIANPATMPSTNMPEDVHGHHQNKQTQPQQPVVPPPALSPPQSSAPLSTGRVNGSSHQSSNMEIEDLTADEFYNLPPSPPRSTNQLQPTARQAQPIIIDEDAMDAIMVEQEYEDMMDNEGMEAMLEMEMAENPQPAPRRKAVPQGQNHERHIAPPKKQQFLSPDGSLRSKKSRSLAKDASSSNPFQSNTSSSKHMPIAVMDTKVTQSPRIFKRGRGNSNSESPLDKLELTAYSNEVEQDLYVSSFSDFARHEGKTVKIQAEFIKKEKFKIKKGRYNLVVQLADQAGKTLQVRISNELMQEQIFGVPAERFAEMMSSQDPALKEQAQRYSAVAQGKLEKLGTREIKIQIPAVKADFSTKLKLPVVLSL